ncbi:hypothetical protein FDN13_13160 [Caloramator sp. E03]|uniref:hypothetical protein n=1 Tax=Caloramator sp. E03 TaxID=2576307 RepID=UPI001110F7E3|nr:hypothetical protein [Caloramator sp. E03]QCX34571.1 hypothetical protein FDN13_13160 [Caloramator sp. E03]
MRKVTNIIFFFLLTITIFYFYNNFDIKKGLTIDEINKIAASRINKTEGEKILNSLKNIDLSRLDIDKQESILKFIGDQNLFEGNRLKDFINSSKKLEGISKELYYKVLYGIYTKNPSEFLKKVLYLNTDDMGKILKAFSDKYIEKPKLISDLQDILKNGKLNKEQKDKINKIIHEIKNSY